MKHSLNQRIKCCIECISYAICKSKYTSAYYNIDTGLSTLLAYYQAFFPECPILSDYFEIRAKIIERGRPTENVASCIEVLEDKQARLHDTFIKSDGGT